MSILKSASSFLSLLAIAGLAASGCASAAARQAESRYAAGDYDGAATIADRAVHGNEADSPLWRIAIRSAMARGDAAQMAAFFDGYQRAHGGTVEDRELFHDIAQVTLEQGLASRSAKVRVLAIMAVEDQLIADLADSVGMLMGDDDDVVVAAASVAVLRGYPQAPHVATSMLKAADPDARRIAVAGITKKVGQIALADTRPLADDQDAGVRAAAIIGIASAADEASRAMVRKHLRDPDANVRAAAVDAIRTGNKTAPDALAIAASAIADTALAVRLAGIELASAIHDTAALTKLVALSASDDDVLLAAHAAAALGTSADATAAIDRALASARPSTRAAALNLLSRALSDDEAAKRARDRLKDPDADVRLTAARTLISLNHVDEATTAELAMLRNPAHAIDAAADLAALGNPDGIAALSNAALSSNDTRERLHAVRAHRQAHRITPGLIAALADANGEIRVVAAQLILALGAPHR